MTSPDTPHPLPTDPPPGRLPRGLIVVLTTAGLLVSVLGLQQFRSILAPVLLALVLVVGLYPLTGFLERRGAPRWLALTGTLLTLVVILVGLAAATAVSIGQLATLLPTYQDRFTQLVAQGQQVASRLGVGPEQIQAALSGVDFGKVAGVAVSVLNGLTSTLSNLVLLVLVAGFMVLDSPNFARRFALLKTDRPGLVTAMSGFTAGTRSYLLVSTVFGLIVAVLDTLLVWVLGVPLPLLWGLLAFITNYIPNIGFVIGLVPPALLALLVGGPKLLIIVIVGYVVINFVIQSVIQPKYVGDAVDLSLTLTLLSLVFWSFVLGPVGAILAIPLTLLVKALLIDIDPTTQWISSLLSGGPAPAAAPGEQDPAAPSSASAG